MKKLLLLTSFILTLISTQTLWSMANKEETGTSSIKRKIAKGKVKTQFGELSYRDSGGTGPVVLCVHGNSTSNLLFKELMRANPDLRFIAFDSPGHGTSFGSKNGTNPDLSEDSARQVYTFKGCAMAFLEGLKQLGIDESVKIAGIGISKGGHELINLAALVPDRIDWLVISGTPPLPLFPDRTQIPVILGSAFKQSSASGLSGKATPFSLEEARLYLQVNGINPDENPKMVQSAINTDGRARAYMFESAMADRDRVDEVETLRKLKRPVLILGGKEDGFINYDYVKGLELPANVQLIVQEGERHSFVSNHPELFNEIMMRNLVKKSD